MVDLRTVTRLACLFLTATFLSLGTLSPAAAADFSCGATVNRTSVPRGDNVILTVTAEGSVSLSAEFQLAEIPGVQVFRSGTNQSVSFSNGTTNTTISKTYYLRVEAGADFVIPPVRIVSQGKACITEAIAIKVTAGQGTTGIPPADTGNRIVPTDPAAALDGGHGGRAGDDIFITLESDLQEAWIGQQIVLSFKYYRRIQPWNNPQFSPPRTEGFWREDLGEERNFRTMVQGRSYSVTEIRYAIFPSRFGKLVIQPAELSFPDQGLDRFFSSRRQRGPRVLRTRPLTITVKDLPRPRPADYSGLVATQVRLTAQAGRSEIPRGEALDLKVTLVSDGFLKGFAGLEIPAPLDSRLHDAGDDFATSREEGRLISRIGVEKVIVPAREGPLHLPPVSLTWFDAGKGDYVTSATRDQVVAVLPSDLPRDEDAASGFLRAEVSRLGQDLAFIHGVPNHLARGSVSLGSSAAWWLGLLLPLAGLGGWRFYLSLARARDRDPAGRRRRLSLKVALAHLDEAAAAEDPAARLALVDRAVNGYVADNLNLSPAAIGADQVQAFCEDAGQRETGQALLKVLCACDDTRFGGAPEPGEETLVERTGTLLRLLEKVVSARRVRRSEGGATATALLALFALSALLPTHEALAAVDPVQLLAEANQAYTEGDLELARQKYLAVREAGVNDAVLHFNLGNTYARRGEFGRAVASYLRAQRLDPRNGDIRSNLRYVRNHLQDLELVDQELPLFIAQFVGLARSLTVREWGAVLVVLVWTLSALIAWGWYREGFSDALRRAGLVMAAVLLVVVSITVWRWYGEEIRQRGVVIVEEVSVRSGPSESFPVMFQVHDGLTVQLEGERENWRRINLGGQSLGWLPAASLEMVALPPADVQGR